MVEKLSFLELMFTGFGGMGRSLLELDVRPDQIFGTDMPEEDVRTIEEVVKRLYRRKVDISGLVSGAEVDSFVGKLENNYPIAIGDFKGLIDGVMPEFFTVGVPEPEHIVDVCDYRNIVKKANRLYYGLSDKVVQERIKAFNNNPALQRSLEEEDIDVNLRFEGGKYRNDYRIKKRKVDVFSARAKLCSSVTEKIAIRKIPYFWKKIKESRKAGKPLRLTYGDVLLKDLMGFLIVAPDPSKIRILDFLRRNNLTPLRTKLETDNGYYQKTNVIDKEGNLYEVRLCDMKEWITRYFEDSKKIGEGKEESERVKSHQLYKSFMKNKAAEEDPKNPEVMDVVEPVLYNLIGKHCKTMIREPIHEVYLSKNPWDRERYLKEITEESIKKIKGNASHPETKKNEGITEKNTHTYLREVLTCYSEKLRDIQSKSIEEVFEDNGKKNRKLMFGEDIKDTENSIEEIDVIYRKAFGSGLPGQYIANYEVERSRLEYILRANNDIRDIEEKTKRSPEKGFIRYHALQQEFNKKMTSDSRLVVQTKFDIMKGVVENYGKQMKKEKDPSEHVKSLYSQFKSDFEDFTFNNIDNLKERLMEFDRIMS